MLWPRKLTKKALKGLQRDILLKKLLFWTPRILNTLYLMVKQAFPFKGLVFLEYLMEVAYGAHREEHSQLQDMAAVCCAIISTQNATDASTPTVNVAQVVKDNAAFVHALERVPDPKMQIWHYRLLTGGGMIME